MPLLEIITVSTRDARKGPAVSTWFERQAREHGRFTIERIDLRDINLPMFDEPEHPRLRRYHHEHTKAWSAIVDRADAYVFVIPEYNHSMPPSFVNALDYVSQEWGYKPAAFVSYGGVSGGVRSVQMAKQLVTALRMMPIFESVVFPFFTKSFDARGEFAPDEAQSRVARAMLDELLRWAEALKVLRPARA